METGTVKWFRDDKGFGFIVPDRPTLSGKMELFVHQTVVRMEGFRTLVMGERVRFNIGKGPDGRDQAIDVERLDPVS